LPFSLWNRFWPLQAEIVALPGGSKTGKLRLFSAIHKLLSDHHFLLLPLGFHLAPLVGRALACGDFVEARRFASIRTWE
jgi:hypothetical protein